MIMETGFLHLHNLIRWVILLLALVVLLRSISAMSSRRAFHSADRRLSLFLMIFADIQLLLGLALYFMKDWIGVLTRGGFMSNAYNRFYAMEHTLGMLLGILFIHLGYTAAKSKALSDSRKFKRVFWMTLIGLVCILITIPWPFREGVGRALFPGA